MRGKVGPLQSARLWEARKATEEAVRGKEDPPRIVEVLFLLGEDVNTPRALWYLALALP